MSPLGCTATPVGRCSCPGERPRMPKRLLNWPSLENICKTNYIHCNENPHRRNRPETLSSALQVRTCQSCLNRSLCTRSKLSLHHVSQVLSRKIDNCTYFITTGGGRYTVRGHTCTHWLLLSAINIFPLVEAATPWRFVNSPLFLPLVPKNKL